MNVPSSMAHGVSCVYCMCILKSVQCRWSRDAAPTCCHVLVSAALKWSSLCVTHWSGGSLPRQVPAGLPSLPPLGRPWTRWGMRASTATTFKTIKNNDKLNKFIRKSPAGFIFPQLFAMFVIVRHVMQNTIM